ncbi:MAG: CHASE domain-containing protein, partial [Acidimicrobiia bacterium]|nr:CHASE domain-containing protein [Acidimicrobiia bacterium]
MAATIGRGLGAPIYLGRVNGLLDGAVADDSASLARLAGPLPSNGVVGTIALAKVDGTRVVVTAEVPAESPALAVGTDLAAMPANRVAFDLARDDGTPSLADAQRSATGETSALIAYPQYGSPSIPATTEDRRGKVQGYLVALVTPR